MLHCFFSADCFVLPVASVHEHFFHRHPIFDLRIIRIYMIRVNENYSHLQPDARRAIQAPALCGLVRPD